MTISKIAGIDRGAAHVHEPRSGARGSLHDVGRSDDVANAVRLVRPERAECSGRVEDEVTAGSRFAEGPDILKVAWHEAGTEIRKPRSGRHVADQRTHDGPFRYESLDEGRADHPGATRYERSAHAPNIWCPLP